MKKCNLTIAVFSYLLLGIALTKSEARYCLVVLNKFLFH